MDEFKTFSGSTRKGNKLLSKGCSVKYFFYNLGAASCLEACLIPFVAMQPCIRPAFCADPPEDSASGISAIKDADFVLPS